MKFFVVHVSRFPVNNVMLLSYTGTPQSNIVSPDHCVVEHMYPLRVFTPLIYDKHLDITVSFQKVLITVGEWQFDVLSSFLVSLGIC